VLNNNEIWKPVKGFENFYEVSDLGKIRNKRGNLMKFYINNKGYACIDFRVNTVRTKKLVHRVVAETFLENVDKLPEVNHKDEVKSNNAVTNLEWCSRSHNKQYSMATGTYNKIYTNKNSLGKKHLPNPTSIYHNVGFDKARGKWTATIRHEGKNLERKRFNSEEEAALHVNYLIDKYGLYDRPKNIIQMPND